MNLSHRLKRSLRVVLALILTGSAAGAHRAEAGATITLGSGFYAPSGVALDASGNVFVADTYNYALKKILPAGGYTTVNTIGSAFTVNLPSSIAVDSSGNVWFIDIQNGVRETPAPGYTTVNPIGVGSNQAQGIAVDASGNLFVADTGNHQVVEILAASGYTTANTLGSGFSSPSGVAVDANGNVFVVDYLNSMVYEILKAGGYTTVNPLAQLTNCTGIAVDASANVYVACPYGIAKILAPNYTNVTSIGSGFNNPTGVAVDASGNVFVADTNNNAVKEITVALPPTITKVFGTATTPPNSSTSLTFTLTNPNPSTPLRGVAFTDNLPAGLVVATPNGLANTCGGTATAIAGASSASLSGAILPGGGSCTMSIGVTGTTLGVKDNSVQVISTNGGAGNTSNATLTVSGLAPTITKGFGAATIQPGEATSLTFTLANPNAAALDGVAFTDNLPGGMVVVTPNGLTNTCGGSATANAGSASASLSGAALAAGASCTMVVSVTAQSFGAKNNSVQVTSTNGGTGNTSNASLTVTGLPPTITKAFGAATIQPDGITSLTFTLTNPNTAGTLAGVAFTDHLPGGMVVATPNGLSNTCGGSATAAAATPTASLSGATLAAGASCTMVVSVTSGVLGAKNNSVQVTSSAGVGNTSNATVTVAALPPTITKVFGAATIPLNGTTSLTFTLTNPNATISASNVDFTDSLPAGLVVATPSGLTTNCSGAVVFATAGSTSASMAGTAMNPGASCTMAIVVQGTTVGVKNNSVQVSSSAGGTGNTSNASVTVSLLPPGITKVFGAAKIPLTGSTSLTFTLSNPNPGAALTGVAFTDSLPAGLVVATPNGLTNNCGGTATAVAGATSAGLSGATLAANASCTVVVGVQGTTVGVKNNSVQVASTNGGTGNTSNASLTVSTLVPQITKAFGAGAIELNGTTTLTFTLANPDASQALTGVAFTDNLPAGLLVATPNGLTNTCGGTATAIAGAASASLSGATLAAGVSCTMVVVVQGTTFGAKNNSVQVTSTNGGVGNTSNATLTIGTAPPTITKAFGATTVTLIDGSASLTFTLGNPNASTSLTGVAFMDAFPAGLVVATPSGLTNTCSGTSTADAGASSASLSDATLAPGASCTVAVQVQGTALGPKNNSVQVTSANAGNGNTSNATLLVGTCARGDTTYCDGFEAAKILTLGSGFSNPQGVAVDASGNVFVADHGNSMVKEILAPGYTTVNTLGSGFLGPNGVAVDASGNVFVADSSHDLVKEILAAGGYTTVSTLAGGFNSPFGIAVDAGGNVFVGDLDNNAVKEILAVGGYSTIITLGSGFTRPSGAAVDASGNVFVTDTNNNAVKELLAPGYTTIVTLGSGFFLPYGVAVDTGGNVFVADYANNAVKEILKTGGYTTVNTLGSGFSHPSGVAVDSSGNVFVADSGNNAIKVIVAPSGHN